MCALSGPTTGSCKALPHIGETVFTTLELDQFSGESFTEGLSPPLITSRASHVKICIFSSDTSIRGLLTGGPWLRHFTLTQYLFTPSPSPTLRPGPTLL